MPLGVAHDSEQRGSCNTQAEIFSLLGFDKRKPSAAWTRDLAVYAAKRSRYPQPPSLRLEATD